MEMTNFLEYSERTQLREWLMANHAEAKECWVTTYRTKIPREDAIPYLDMVEEALCFGWIDSTYKRLPDGRGAQRLSPRRKTSHWTELNIRRCEELERRGLMTDAGRAALPKEKSERSPNYYDGMFQNQEPEQNARTIAAKHGIRLLDAKIGEKVDF